MLTFNNILYVYSDAAANQQALEKTVEVAKKNQAKLTILFTLSGETIPDSLGFSRTDIAKFIEEKELEREKVIKQYSDNISIEQETILSNSYVEVIEKVQEKGFDLLIKPSEKEGLIGRLFGSNDMGYLRQCPCPVWLINQNQVAENKTIVAAVDVDDSYPEHEQEIRQKLNLEVIASALTLAVSNGGKLQLVSAWSAQLENTLRYSSYLNKSEAEVDAYINEAESKHQANFDKFMAVVEANLDPEALKSITLERVSIKGSAKEALPNYLKSLDADTVVMGTVARVGIKGLIIGNTAENILYRLNQSVLALKPEGFDSLVN